MATADASHGSGVDKLCLERASNPVLSRAGVAAASESVRTSKVVGSGKGRGPEQAR